MNRILIVEDDDDIALTMEQVLTEEGYIVGRAKTGLQGLDALHGLNGCPMPDLVLLDLHIPELSGQEFVRAKNGDPSVKQIPVIVITAMNSHQARGVDLDNVLLIVHKPFDVDALLHAIDFALHPRETRPSIL